MATPVPTDAIMQKQDGIQFHRGVPNPRQLTKVVWTDARRSLGLGRSHGRMGTRQTRVGFVRQRFSSSQHHCAVFDARFIPPGKFSKTVNRNAHYIVAFKNPRDQMGIRTILLQAFPE